MPRRVFNKTHLDFLRTEYKKMKVEDLTVVFNEKFNMNQTLSSIRSVLRKNGIKCGRTGNDRLINRTRIFTEEHKNFIKWTFRKIAEKEIAAHFNAHFGTSITTNQIKGCITNHKIRAGRTGCFKKNNKPWNHGTKGQGLTGANKRSFKAGSVPPNRKPMGHERMSKDGFIEIKVPERNPNTGFPTRFKHKHRYVWEQHNGPIPDGMIVAFKDSDRTNCDPDNLMLVTRHELLVMNQYRYKEMPVEIKPSVMAITKLHVKTREVQKS